MTVMHLWLAHYVEPIHPSSGKNPFMNSVSKNTWLNFVGYGIFIVFLSLTFIPDVPAIASISLWKISFYLGAMMFLLSVAGSIHAGIRDNRAIKVAQKWVASASTDEDRAKRMSAIRQQGVLSTLAAAGVMGTGSAVALAAADFKDDGHSGGSTIGAVGTSLNEGEIVEESRYTPAFNIDGTPMFPGGQLDINGNPWGITSDPHGHHEHPHSAIATSESMDLGSHDFGNGHDSFSH
jgi:hypothetical protein